MLPWPCKNLTFKWRNIMALNNENNPHMLVIAVGSPAADAKTLAGLPSGSKMVIHSVHMINQATIAADDADFAQIALNKGAIGSEVEVAELDTRAAHEDGLVANIPELMNLSASEMSGKTRSI